MSGIGAFSLFHQCYERHANQKKAPQMYRKNKVTDQSLIQSPQADFLRFGLRFCNALSPLKSVLSLRLGWPSWRDRIVLL